MIRPKTIFVSGPRGGGKTRLVDLMVHEAMQTHPHYLRLIPKHGERSPFLQLVRPGAEAALASSQLVVYNAERCFEVIAEALQTLPPGSSPYIVLLEGDGDPCLRYAYPYDRRIFVMPAPSNIYEVFRTPEQAAVALRKVMEDTADFAAEIFGLFDEDQIEQNTGLLTPEGGSPWSWDRQAHQAITVDEGELRNFIESPIGMEIASRIQLQPEYQGLVESDVILVNVGVGATTGVVDEVARRLELLLSRIRSQAQNDGLLFCCDPCERCDPRRVKLFEKLCLMNHALAS